MRVALKLARMLTLVVMLGNLISGVVSGAAAPLLPLGVGVAHADGLPDLAPVSLSVPGGLLLQGQTYTANFSVRNDGTVATTENWVDELYLSSDPFPDTGDRFLGAVAHDSGPLAPGETYTVQLVFTLVNAPAGNLYLLVRADANATLDESNNANNVFTAQVNITSPPPPGPDLVIDRISAPAGPLLVGSTVVVGMTVRNAGTAAAPRFWSDGL